MQGASFADPSGGDAQIEVRRLCALDNGVEEVVIEDAPPVGRDRFDCVVRLSGVGEGGRRLGFRGMVIGTNGATGYEGEEK
jgi:hypothetical protein